MEEQKNIKLTNSILKIILDTNCRVHGGSKKTNKETWMVFWRMMVPSDEGGKCKDGEDTSKVPYGTQTKIQILKVDSQGPVRKDSPPHFHIILDILQNDKPITLQRLCTGCHPSVWEDTEGRALPSRPSHSCHLLISNVFCSKRPSFTTLYQQPPPPFSHTIITCVSVNTSSGCIV